MRNRAAIFVFLMLLAGQAAAQSLSRSSGNPPAPPGQSVEIDGIAARIGNDVVMESQVRQLQAYQRLIEGQAQSRAKVLDELVDQWIVRGEALETRFPRPNSEEVTQEYQALRKHFPSAAQFQSRLASAGLTVSQVRSILEDQLYYVRFLNFKFHAETNVTLSQIAAYYHDTFLPQLRERRLSMPPLRTVEAQIRQLLTQESINEKAAKWLDDTKAKLKIVILPASQQQEGSG